MDGVLARLGRLHFSQDWFSQMFAHRNEARKVMSAAQLRALNLLSISELSEADVRLTESAQDREGERVHLWPVLWVVIDPAPRRR